MSELRVPTSALDVEVLCADGRILEGRIFVAAASRHAGPMRVEEMMNEGATFFPFLPDGASRSIILNKLELICVTVGVAGDTEERLDEVPSPSRRVRIECGSHRFEGRIVIDMPAYQSRVLDYLNRGERFLTLRAEQSHQLIQKRRITRVIEMGEE